MSGRKRTGQAALTRLVLAVMLLGLGGCLATHDRDLAASWYLVDKEIPKPVPDEIAANVDDIYLALVNRGSKWKPLYRLFMNGQELDSFAPLLRLREPYVIAPGQVLILPTGIFTSNSTCRLPVTLAVRTKKKRQRQRPIRLIGTMPGALPSEWLEKCRR